MFGKLRRLAAGAACILLAAPACEAHEFWMQPERFGLRPGEPANVSMFVGENYSGGLVAMARPFFVRFAQQGESGATDLRAFLPPEGAAGEAEVPIAGSGTQLVFADAEPAQLVLEAGRFFAYLHEEGLDFINASRESAGLAGSPGRERFRRHVKTLVRVDGDHPPAASRAAMRPTGQTLEIVPLADPYESAAGRDIAFQVFFEGRPLAGALVKFWHRRAAQTHIVRATTGPQGLVQASFAWPGAWMASVVHMRAATDTAGCACDWESHWGSLTFELPARGTQAR